MTERRHESRQLTCIFAGYEQPSDEREHVALIHDVSEHGATLYTREELNVGQHLELELLLDEDPHKTSPASANVVHCERLPWEGSVFWIWKAGVKLEESVEKYRDAIDALHARQRRAGFSVA